MGGGITEPKIGSLLKREGVPKLTPAWGRGREATAEGRRPGGQRKRAAGAGAEPIGMERSGGKDLAAQGGSRNWRGAGRRGYRSRGVWSCWLLRKGCLHAGGFSALGLGIKPFLPEAAL